MLFLALICLFGSLLAKETALTFLLVAPLSVYFISNKRQPVLITFVSTLFLVLFYFIIRFSVLGLPDLGAEPRELLNNPFLKWDGSAYIAFSTSERFGTILFVLFKYLYLSIIPHPLVHDYYPRHVAIHDLSEMWVWISFLAYSLLVIISVLGMRHRKMWAYAILFFLLTLFITSNILLPVGTNMSERFLFLPSVGVSLLLAYFLVEFASNPKLKKLLWSLFAVLIIAYGFKTIDRNRVWKNNFTLFTTDVKLAPNSAKLRNAAAGSLLTAYQFGDTDNKAFLDKAIEHLQHALTIHPQYKNANLLMGNAYLFKEAYDESFRYYKESLRLDPNYAEARNNLLIAYRQGGRYFGEKKGDLNKAIDLLEKANAMRSGDYETLRLLGVAHGQKGVHRLAAQYMEEAVKVNPKYGEAWYNLGIAYFNLGEIAKKDSVMRKAIELDPKIADRFVK